MKTIKSIIISCMMLFGCLSGEKWLDNNIPVNVKKISERVIVLTVDGAMDNNTIAINTQKGIVVVDTTLSPGFAKLIRKRIEQEFNRHDFTYVINTHFHGDHTFGNQMFPEAIIIGHEKNEELMIERTKAMPALIGQLERMVKALQQQLESGKKGTEMTKKINQKKICYSEVVKWFKSGFVLTPPNLAFNDRLSLNLGDVTLNLSYFGMAHSGTDIIITCPEEGLVLTGDLFSPGNKIYISSERVPSLPRWRENLEGILNNKKINTIIPGHGEFLTLANLQEQLDYVKKIQKEFSGKSSALTAFKEIYHQKGVEAGLKKLRESKAEPDKFYFLHPELDTFAYRLMNDNKLQDALKIFKLLAEFFPDSYIAFDSLGEVYLKIGNTKLARHCFERSLQMNPSNHNATAKLKSLGSIREK